MADMYKDEEKPPTFASVWALIQENAQKAEERAKAVEQEMAQMRREREARSQEREVREKERAEEFKREMEKLDASLEVTKRMVEENSHQMGGLHNRFGELAEHLVLPGIARRFYTAGIDYPPPTLRKYKVLGEYGKIKTEIDALLQNAESLVAVEVKVEPTLKDIEHHCRRLEILRRYSAIWIGERLVRGAIAGAIFGQEEKNAAIEAGFYVFEQSGDTIKMAVPKDFVPKEW